jgi:hypothetical protein
MKMNEVLVAPVLICSIQRSAFGRQKLGALLAFTRIHKKLGEFLLTVLTWFDQDARATRHFSRRWDTLTRANSGFAEDAYKARAKHDQAYAKKREAARRFLRSFA